MNVINHLSELAHSKVRATMQYFRLLQFVNVANLEMAASSPVVVELLAISSNNCDCNFLERETNVEFLLT